MTFQAVPDTAEIVIQAARGGQTILTTFYARNAAAWVTSDLIILGAAVDGWVDTHLRPSVSPSYDYLNTHLRDLRTIIGFEADVNTSAGVGLRGASTGPNSECLAISRQSGLAGRSARGRVYWPDIPDEDKTDNNHVDPARVAVYAAALNSLTAAINGAGWTEVIVSRRSAGVLLAVASTLPVVNYIARDNVIDSQRRRLPGRGV